MGHAHHHHGPVHRGDVSEAGQRLLRRVGLASVAVSGILLLAKLWAWSQTGAASLLSSLADSMFDVIVSWMNFFAIRYAIKPADDEHRFGHQGIEDIVGLAQFAFLSGAMLFVVAQAINGLIEGVYVQEPQDGIAVMVLSLVLTSGLVLYQRHVYRATGSLIVRADSLHYYSDLLMNLSIIGSLLAIVYAGITWLDGVLALLIAVYVMKEGWEVGRHAFNNLMNKEMPEAEKQRIYALMAQMPEVKGVHKLKTRYLGTKPFIQLHVDLSQSLSFLEAHTIVDRLEHEIEHLFPGADVIVHPDPIA